MAARTTTRPVRKHASKVVALAPPLAAAQSALDNPMAEKCLRAFALLEEAWDLIHDVLDEAGERGVSNPEWQAKIPAMLPEQAVEPLRNAICWLRPCEDFPAGTTRAELEACAQADDSYRH